MISLNVLRRCLGIMTVIGGRGRRVRLLVRLCCILIFSVRRGVMWLRCILRVGCCYVCMVLICVGCFECFDCSDDID